MTKTKIYRHLTTTTYDIEVLEEFRAPITPVIARQIGMDVEIIPPGPATLEVHMSNNNFGISTVLRQGDSALPLGKVPGEHIKFRFIVPNKEIEEKQLQTIEKIKLFNDMVTAKRETAALKRTIKVISTALDNALPNIRLVVKDEEAQRIWNEFK